LLQRATDALAEARKAMDVQAIHAPLAAIFAAVAEANPYFAAQAPWALRESDPQRMQAVLYTTAECVRRLAILCQAFMPDSSARLLDILAVPEDRRLFADLEGDSSALTPGTPLPAPQPVFPRYVEAKSA